MFFYPNGKPLDSVDTFVKLYSSIYFYANRDLCLENEIDRILRIGIKDKNDIAKIMKWKTGGKPDGDNVNTRYQIINVRDIYAVIEKVRDEDKRKDTSEHYNDLYDKVIELTGMGSVYARTIVYFYSGGNCPIYDKYVDIALNAIQQSNDKDFFEIIIRSNDRIINNPAGNDGFRAFDNAIFRLFGKSRYLESRDVDRALWAYGHLFNDTKQNNKRLECSDGKFFLNDI